MKSTVLTENEMANTDKAIEHQSQPDVYEIRLKGHLDARWTGWFDGFTITLTENGETVLTGSVADQAALHGLLKKVRDLGLPLLSINPINHKENLK
jgi:hypothetical protein